MAMSQGCKTLNISLKWEITGFEMNVILMPSSCLCDFALLSQKKIKNTNNMKKSVKLMNLIN